LLFGRGPLDFLWNPRRFDYVKYVRDGTGIARE